MNETPKQKEIEISSDTFTKQGREHESFITSHGLIIIGLVILSIIAGFGLVFLPQKYQLSLVFLFPVAVIVFLIIRNPYLGLFVFILIDYARPQYFIPQLRVFKLGVAITVLTIISFIIQLVVTKKKIYWDRFNWTYLFFIAIIGVSVLTASNNYRAFVIFQLMLTTFIIYFMATNLIKTSENLGKLIWMMLAVHLFFSIKGILEGGYAGGTLMGDENDFALALNTMVPFAFFIFTNSENLFKKYFSLIILISLILGVISSMSRGGWVGLVAVLFFCILKSNRKLLSFSLIIILALIAFMFAPPEYWDEIKTISDTHESTAATRLNYWEAAVRMFLEHPIIGVGADNGGFQMPHYVSGFANPLTQWGRTFHGTLPQVLAEMGILGFGSYIAMIIMAILYLRRIIASTLFPQNSNWKIYANSILGGIIGYLATATFLSTAFYPQLWTMFLFSVVLKRSYDIKVSSISEITPEI
ncbi:MAG: O-antigen ligase family protein [Candidatus Zixiibacteriota bacterium]